jgi:hypothetical protein
VRRLLKTLVFFGVLAAAARALINSWEEERAHQEAPAGGERREQGRESPPESLSRDELYEEAKRLDIAGRSRMTKAELQRAIANEG